MKYNLIRFFICAITLIFVSCDKKEMDSATPKLNSTITENTSRPTRPIILGKQKNNPFSVTNMKIALDSLRSYVHDTNDGALCAKSVDEMEIKPTDLYVRFLALDSTQNRILHNDTTLTLFDYPLDYEIKQNGDYYQDATLKTPYTWQYTTVKPGYVPHKGIKYEILSELFIIENSEDYTEEIITDSMMQRKPARIRNSLVVDKNICNALYAISFTLTGNKNELNTSASQNGSSAQKVTVPNCTTYSVGRSWWKVSWTSCDPFYYPDGYIRVRTPKGEVGLKGVQVRMTNWFTYGEAQTRDDGYYYCEKTRFNSLWIGNVINYSVYYYGRNGNRTWSIDRSIGGAICLWTSWYGAGSHSPNGFSMTFETNSDFWGRSVQNNAIYDYINYATTAGIALPPVDLKIATMYSNDFTSSAPLLSSHFNFSLIYAFPSSQAVLLTLLQNYSFVNMLMPDLILRYNLNINNYNEITATAWHELTHASQLERMKTEKGYDWASIYWSNNVYRQASNSKNRPDKSCYGIQGDTDWQQIALSEGWANYRAWELSKNNLNYNAISDLSWSDAPYSPDWYTSFPYKFAGMFYKFKNIGCSFTDLEKSLCTYSVAGYCDNLKEKYPNLSIQIDEIKKGYE
jgi:hypothetical protein